jgi:hypothetical protein
MSSTMAWRVRGFEVASGGNVVGRVVYIKVGLQLSMRL